MVNIFDSNDGKIDDFGTGMTGIAADMVSTKGWFPLVVRSAVSSQKEDDGGGCGSLIEHNGISTILCDGGSGSSAMDFGWHITVRICCSISLRTRFVDNDILLGIRIIQLQPDGNPRM